MQAYKWSRIKTHAICKIGTLAAGCWTTNGISMCAVLQAIEQQITGEPIKSWRENAKDITSKAIAIVKNWDIRRAKTLLELFPDTIAKKYHNQPFVAEYDEKGNWVIIFN